MAKKDMADDILGLGAGEAPDILPDDVTPDVLDEAPGERSEGVADAPADIPAGVPFSFDESDSFAFDGDTLEDGLDDGLSDDDDDVSAVSAARPAFFGDDDAFLDFDGVGASVAAPMIDDGPEDGEEDGTAPGVRETTLRGSHLDDVVVASAGSETVRTHKGADSIDAGAGDDLVISGHGDDVLDGGSGDDVLNGGKGNDTLVYTLSENIGGEDRYDGDKGSDTLELRLTVEEFNDLREELISLQDWMAEHNYVKASSGIKFKDSSSSGAEKHAVFETSFGLDVRYIENLKVVVEGHGEVDLDEPLDVSEPEPVTVNVSEAVAEDAPVSLTLEAGSTTTVSINVDVTETPPIYDVFMVQDLSGSFYDDLPNVKALMPSLMESLSAESDVAFGISSFTDKPFEPFGWSGAIEYGFAPDYAYRTEMGITTDYDAIQAKVDTLRTSTGGDYPESQLEALVQTALRGAEIGFRDGAQKYVVLTTDAPFHQEGDMDNLWIDGTYHTVADNDYDTNLEMEDYPEVTKVGNLLAEAGITPIFAVTSAVMPDYQALVDAWGFGSVVELAADSANIVDAITTGITETTVDLTLDVAGDDYGYVTGMTPEVYPDAGPGSYTFDITLEIPDDTSSVGSDDLSISIPGYGTIDLDIDIAGMDLSGDDAANTLVGDDGNNIIDGLAGDDILTGGAGDDTFVFADGSGTDRITDFTNGDLLDLRRMTTVVTAADVLAAASQVGVDTVIDFGAGDGIILEGVDATSLTAEDMLI